LGGVLGLVVVVVEVEEVEEVEVEEVEVEAVVAGAAEAAVEVVAEAAEVVAAQAGMASSWFPSAPWNELPGSGFTEGGSGVALAARAIRKPAAKALASTTSRPPEARRRLTTCRVLGSTSFVTVVRRKTSVKDGPTLVHRLRGVSQALRRPGFGELASRLDEVLGKDLHVREHRHEVRVSRPPRDEVQVNVVGDARACDPSQVPAQVVALRLVDLSKGAHALRSEPVDLDRLIGLELAELSGMPRGRDQQVPGRIGELVQEHERSIAAVDDEPVLVGAFERAAEDAAVLLVGATDVLESPGSPELPRHRQVTLREALRETDARDHAQSPLDDVSQVHKRR